MSDELSVIDNTLPLATDGLQSYMQRVNAIPLLSAQEEKDLATRYHQEGDLLAAEQLVLAHLRYVARIAYLYKGYGLATADLIQEGTIGLMKAVKRFDPAMNVRLISFAVHWIKSEIHEFIIRNWRIVKVATTKAQRKLFFNLRQAKKRLGWFSQEEIERVAQDLGVSPKDVLEMETRLNAHDASLDLHPTDDDMATANPAHYLPAPQEHEPLHTVIEGNYSANVQQQLQYALDALDARSLDIVSRRWLDDSKTSLKELAEKYQVSIERIRQIEKIAMEKLRSTMQSEEEQVAA